MRHPACNASFTNSPYVQTYRASQLDITMRMTLSISAALVAVWLAYAVSPFVSVYRLVGAVEERNVAALSVRVDFHAVRKSLAEQIARTHLTITGKLGRAGRFPVCHFLCQTNLQCLGQLDPAKLPGPVA